MGFHKYADFSTRSTRSEFWWFQLGYFLILFPLCIIMGVMTFVVADSDFGSGVATAIPMIIIGLLVSASIIPQIAIMVRRIHDTGNSGWMYLLTMIPYIGFIAYIIFGVMETQQKTNKWGPVPGEENEDALRDALLDFDEETLV